MGVLGKEVMALLCCGFHCAVIRERLWKRRCIRILVFEFHCFQTVFRTLMAGFWPVSHGTGHLYLLAVYFLFKDVICSVGPSIWLMYFKTFGR